MTRKKPTVKTDKEVHQKLRNDIKKIPGMPKEPVKRRSRGGKVQAKRPMK